MNISGMSCPKCGKLLDGLDFDYEYQWICSDCIEDKTDILHAENGCKCRVITFNAGHDYEEKEARELLKDKVEYTIDFVSVGGWSSCVYLKEFPNKSFNSVFFIRTK